MSKKRRHLLTLQQAAFSPTTISGLTLWVDASRLSGLSNNDPVSSFTDFSGLGNHMTQSTADDKPLYKTNALNGLPVVRFDGISDWVRTNANLGPQPLTVFVVGKKNDAANDEFFFDGVGGARALMGRSGDAWVIYASTAVGSGGTADTSAHIFDTILNAASSKLYVGGGTAVVSGVNIGTHGMTLGTTLGASYETPPTAFAAIDIAEMTVHGSSLSATNQNFIGNYLAAKWGLSWTAVT